MPLEIERKFLLKNANWRQCVDKEIAIKQGFLNSHVDRTVRVRITNDKALLTIKSKTVNTTRQEFEYEIPVPDAQALLQLCERPLIEKTRFIISQDNKTWEIDEFWGENEGLIVAEVELSSENEELHLPDWVGEEVSQDSRYYNSALIKNPFKNWENK